MDSGPLASASGLRPLGAFVVIGAVVAVVLGRVGYVVVANDFEGRRLPVHVDRGAELAYGIEDRHGVPLALFLERLDLEMSPRSMWQAHTPGYMASRIAEVLGPPFTPAGLLSAMLPGAERNRIRARGFDLDAQTAARVEQWIAGEGPFERSVGAPLPGVALVFLPDGTRTLEWEPAVLLARQTRDSHGGACGPITWTRHLADGLGQALFGPLPTDVSEREREERRSEIWGELMPPQWCRVAADVPPERASALADLLRREGVERLQMTLVSRREREYPAGPFPVLGHWGFVDEGQSLPRAYSGLERLCDEILSLDEWSFTHTAPASYAYRRDRPARKGLSPYYLGRSEAAEPPRVQVALDVALQRVVRARLERVMEEHRAAVALAMVVEVESGEVLAADGVSAYGMAAFPPAKHLFMPGSTFKLVTMATALEAGVVRPGEKFEVGNGEWTLWVGGRARTIHEAEGSATGSISASECLAHSVNAGLVQIGLRVDPAYFRARLDELGYGKLPRAGLGGEEPGSIPALPWKTLYSHASVCFGYEVLTTAWQHMQALCTVLRGGVFRELEVADSIVHGSERYELRRPDERRVFSRDTCDRVREMMELGARIGTGKALWRDDIVMGTKTGTAERVPDEVCLHVFGARARALTEAGKSVTQRDYTALRGVRDPKHPKCHTSSICVVGRLPGSEREIAVLVVVDEPRSGERFGSRVAGPAAMDILVEALGLTRGGRETTPELVAGFAPSTALPPDRLDDSERDQPWRVQ